MGSRIKWVWERLKDALDLTDKELVARQDEHYQLLHEADSPVRQAWHLDRVDYYEDEKLRRGLRSRR